jgi:hypothetical protein
MPACVRRIAPARAGESLHSFLDFPERLLASSQSEKEASELTELTSLVAGLLVVARSRQAEAASRLHLI